MRSFALGAAVAVVTGMVGTAGAETWEAPGSLVGVSVEVEGRSAPLYAAVDGSGRFYVEARAGAGYAIRLASRTRERVAVLVSVDGLNVVSGERVQDLSRRPAGMAGRLYVLDPWGETTIRGWRTNLDEVRRFTFVDERSSYASRSGKSNSKMGWIEVAVFRERRPWRWEQPYDYFQEPREDAPHRDEYGAAPAPEGDSRRKEGSAEAESKARSSPPRAADGASRDRSYPGTGWGSRLGDRAVVVDFEPEETPTERHTLRYEYLDALYALGVLPRYPYRDRLTDRDRGQGGFARPPAW